MKLCILPSRLVRPVYNASRLSRQAVSIQRQARTYASTKDDPNGPRAAALMKDYYDSRPDVFTRMAKGEEVPDIDTGKLEEDNIFAQLDKAQTQKPELAIKEGSVPRKAGDERAMQYLNYALDPEPEKRWAWERKKIIQDSRRGWVISKKEHLLRTERSVRITSPWLKTSIKKLNMVARQLAGKTVDEALLQLRFSPKRVAVEVAKHLEHARDRAIVTRGMGMGKTNNTNGGSVKIKLKDGTKKVVGDKTEIYIDQALVSRGPYTKEAEFRARSRTNLLRRPYTSITFVLKEEITRIREYNERSEKVLRKKPFEPLPDRPITQQRQYVLW